MRFVCHMLTFSALLRCFSIPYGENPITGKTDMQVLFRKVSGFFDQRATTADAGDHSGQLREGEQRKIDKLCGDFSHAQDNLWTFSAQGQVE